MNKSQMINTLTEKTDCPIKTADKVVRIFFDSIKEALSEGDKVEIRGFQGAYRGRRAIRIQEFVEPKPGYQDLFDSPSEEGPVN